MNWLLPIIISCIGLIISYLAYKTQREKMRIFETNHLATLTNDVNTIKEMIKNLRDDIGKLFDEQKDLAERIARIEGRLNNN